MVVAFIFFVGSFVQTAVGFGLALSVMPFLVTVVGLHTATPLVSLIGFTINLYLLIRYRDAFEFNAVKGAILGLLVGSPLGAWGLKQLDVGWLTAVLGLILICYSIYALSNAPLPTLHHKSWSLVVGVLSGLLGGAYGTSGPPIILYGSAKKWEPLTFKSNLQGFFLASSVINIASHTLLGNMTLEVGQNYLFAIPGFLLGVLVGSWFDGRVNAELFRRIVLLVLIILGFRLLWG